MMSAQNVVTEPSICIPRTLNKFKWYEVKKVFEQILGSGTIERVDIRQSKKGDTQFCKIFIHLRYWPSEGIGKDIREKLIKGEDVKVVYDNPWFWKCSASRVEKPIRNQEKVPYVKFDDKKELKEESKEESKEEPKGEGKEEEHSDA